MVKVREIRETVREDQKGDAFSAVGRTKRPIAPPEKVARHMSCSKGSKISIPVKPHIPETG